MKDKIRELKGFDASVARLLMAVFELSYDLEDMRERLGRILYFPSSPSINDLSVDPDKTMKQLVE
jgi:formyltetrahydrofolate synthetase